jgi:hypothetical protein
MGDASRIASIALRSAPTLPPPREAHPAAATRKKKGRRKSAAGTHRLLDAEVIVDDRVEVMG